MRRSLEEEGDIPLFVFDADYDPVKLQQRLEGQPVQILVRLRAVLAVSTPIRASLAHLPTLDGRAVTGRRCEVHGPEHLARTLYGVHTCVDSGYGTVRVRAWGNLHPKACTHEGRGSRGPLPIVVGTLWCWWRSSGCLAPRGGASPKSSDCGGMVLEKNRISTFFGARTSGALTWSTPFASSSRHWDGLHTSSAPSRAGRPVDVAGGGRFHPLKAGPH